MSKKPRILGPDGKPYKAPPTPRGERRVFTDADGTVVDNSRKWFTHTARFQMFVNGSPIGEVKDAKFDLARPTPLADAVEAQVAALTATFDGVGGEELPKPPADLTAYADAFASAAANCDHPDAEDVAYAKREMYCPTCRRYFKRPRSIFGW